MSETDPSNLKNIEIKLMNLVECVLSKAANDSEFAHQLESILLSDSLCKAVSTTGVNKARKLDFNAVNYLHLNGEVKLRDELNSKTDEQLRQILRLGRSRRSRIPKKIERQTLIDEIVINADRTLKQGSSFL